MYITQTKKYTTVCVRTYICIRAYVHVCVCICFGEHISIAMCVPYRPSTSDRYASYYSCIHTHTRTHMHTLSACRSHVGRIPSFTRIIPCMHTYKSTHTYMHACGHYQHFVAISAVSHGNDAMKRCVKASGHRHGSCNVRMFICTCVRMRIHAQM